MSSDYYALWHMRFDDEDRDYDKFLGLYSTQEGAEQGLARLRDKPGFCDHPDKFEIYEGPMDNTSMREGFITVVGDEEVPGPADPNALQKPVPDAERGPKDIPIWALGEEPRAVENGGDFAWRLMNAHYGPGRWSRDNTEFDQLRKFGNRGNRDPRLNVAAGDTRSGWKPDSAPIYYALWHRYVDEWDRDHDSLLGTYSTRKKAKEAIDLLRDQLGFRDYPYSFEITWGRIDETYETEGFVTVPPEEVPASRIRS
jgi:homoserine kinase type II